MPTVRIAPRRPSRSGATSRSRKSCGVHSKSRKQRRIKSKRHSKSHRRVVRNISGGGDGPSTLTRVKRAVHQEDPTIHNQHSTNQHKTSPPVDKEGKWTKTGRALMYGVGAAGTGAITANLLAAPLLADTLYDETDLDEGGRLDKEWKKISSEHEFTPQQLILVKQRFLQTQNRLHYTKEHWKQNAVIGAGLAAAAAGTYGATRHKKDANATKPGKLTRAGRALMYGVGAVGTGAAIGLTASKTGPKYTLADLHEGGSLKKEWDNEKLYQKEINDFNQENPKNIWVKMPSSVLG